MTLATAGIGLLVTILTAVGIQSLWVILLYSGAFIGFLTTIILSFQLYRANAKTLSIEITSSDHERPNLRSLDRKIMGSFILGVALSISIGVASGIQSFFLERDMAEKQINVEKIEKSLDDIQELRPNRPDNQSQQVNKPNEPAKDQSEESGSADESD